MNNTFKQEWSRRQFIYTLGGAGAITLLNPSFSWAADDIDPKVAAIVAKTIGVDTHNHVDVPLNAAEQTGYTVDLAGELKKSGLSAICMTFAVDYQQLKNPGDAYERFINGLNAMDKVLENNQMKRALNLADLRKAHGKKKPIVIQSVEGGHFLEGKLERLQEAYNRGLRHLGLLHDNDASVPLGDIYTKPPQWGGLTAFGADVIKECNRLGIVIDLTHCSNDTINAALKVSTQPIVISHTGLDSRPGTNENYANMMKPRLISKEQAQIVAGAGGVIGVWKHLTTTPEEYVDNIKAMVDIVGADHVCLGTDTKLTPSYRPAGFGGPKPGGDGKDNKPQQGPPAGSNNNGPGPNGPAPQNKPRVGERTNEIWENQKLGYYYTVVGTMLKAGFSEEEIGKIGGGNFCRVFGAATGGK